MADPSPETLSELLVRLRKARLLSRDALAKASGVGYGTIRDLERGIARAPHMSTIRNLADALALAGGERAAFEATALSGARERGGTRGQGGGQGRERDGGPGPGEAGLPGSDGPRPPRPPASEPEPDGTGAPGSAGAGSADTGFADTVAASLLPHDIASFTGREDELRRLVTGARAAHADEDADSESTTESPRGTATGPRGMTAGPRGTAGIFVIEGMGGVGKTTLAVRAAHLVADGFPDGQLFLDLQGYTNDLPALTAHQALRSLLRALGVPNELIPAGRPEREAFYRNTVAGKRLLLICDNASGAAQVRPLIPGTGRSLVIVTSRTSLRSLDDARVLTLRTPPEAEAISLFHAVAGTGGPESGEDRDVADVVRLCGRLPLAVRIVAARLSRRPALRVGDILDELRHEHDRLASLQDEERSVTAVFESSLRSLADPAERLLFQRLSLIPGPDFDVYAAASLTGAGYRETRRLLESLLDHNLLKQQIPGRYRFHDLVRVFARAQGVPDATRATAGLLNYYLRAARLADQAFERGLPRAPYPEDRPARTGTGTGTGDGGGTGDRDGGGRGTASGNRAGRETGSGTRAGSGRGTASGGGGNGAGRETGSGGERGGGQGIWAGVVPDLTTSERATAWLAAELTNLSAAARLAASRKRPDITIGLSAALSDYLRAHGPWPRALALHRAALRAATDSGDPRGQASALRGIGGVLSRTGEIAQSVEMLGKSVDIYRRLGDRRGAGRALIELGIAQRVSGDAGCLATFTEALSAYRELGNRHGQAAALNELGGVRWQTGPIEAAREHLTEALCVYRELGNRQGQAAALLYLGNVQLVMGELGAAESSLTEAGTIGRELGQPVLVANSQLYLGDVQRAAGLLDDAEKSLNSALKGYTDLSHRQGVATALAYLGKTLLTAGARERAADCLAKALEAFGELGDRSGEAETLNAYAAAALAGGQPAVARERYERALRLAEEVRSARDKAEALSGLARLDSDPPG